MFCNNCGNQLKDGAKFCGICGVPVAPMQEAESEPVIETNEQEIIAEPEIAEEITAESDKEVVSEQASVAAPEVVEQEETTTEQYDEVVPEQEETHDFVPLDEIADNQENVFVQPQQPIEPEYYSQPSNSNIFADSIASLKKSLGTVLVIAAIVLYISMIALQVVGSFNPVRADVAGTIAFFDEDFKDYGNYIEMSFDYAPVIVCVGLIPAVLILIGVCINVAQAYRRNGFSPAGFSLIKIAMIIKIIVSSLALVGIVTAMVLADPIVEKVLSEVKNRENVEKVVGDATILGIVVLGVLAAAAAASLAHGIVALVTTHKMKNILILNNQQPKKFIGIRITNYIMAAVNVIKLVIIAVVALAENLVGDVLKKIDSLPNSGRNVIGEMIEDLLEPNLYNIMATVLLIGVYVLFSVNISKYAKKQDNT